MNKTALLGAAPLCLLLAPEASAQTLADQKTAAEIAKLKAETEKIGYDTEKARIDADAAQFDKLRAAQGGAATVASGEKTAEALLLSKASLAGATARLTDILATPYPPSTSIQPAVVWGSAPPSVTQWKLFKEQRDGVLAELAAANGGWDKATSNKMAFLPAAAAIATLAATAISIFKTDTTLTGGAVSIEESDARAALAGAFAEKGYGSFTASGPTDGTALADALLASLDSEAALARKNYKAYAEFYASSRSRSQTALKAKAAGEKLKAALDALKALRGQLLTESSGTLAATLIERQRLLAEYPANHPIVYLVNVDAAYTATTKKGLFTGLGGKVHAFGSVSTIIDYVIAGGGTEVRGSVACTIGNRAMKDALALQPARYRALGAKLCDPVPASQ